MYTTSAIRQLQKFHKDMVINFRLVTEEKYQQKSVWWLQKRSGREEIVRELKFTEIQN